MDIGLVTAFLGGMLAILSPCGALLLPAASVVAVILMIASVVPLVFVLVPRRRARRGSRR